MVILKVFYKDGSEVQESLKSKDVAQFMKEHLDLAEEVKNVEIYEVIK